MAYVRDYAVTEFTSTATTSGTSDMPDHESGDILIVFASKDATGAITQSGSNYTSLQSGSTTGSWGGSWYRRATSNAEPPFVGTWSADSAVFTVISVANPHGSNAPGSVRMAADDTTIPYTATGTLNTPSNNCLAIYGCMGDNTQGPTGWPTDMQVIHAGDSGEAGHGSGWAWFPTSGTSVTSGKRFWAGTADDERIHSIYIEDDGNNSIQNAYVDPTSSITILSHLGGAALSFDGRSWSLPASLTKVMYGKDFDAFYTYDGSNYAGDLTDINDPGTADVALINTTSGITYFGSSATFHQMCIAVSTAGTGSPTSVWEYYNGSTWSTLSTITTGTAGDLNFTATGNKVFRWSIPSNWATTELDASQAPGQYYYIRRRQTANWTIAAVLSQGAVDGMGALYDAVAATADSGFNPYHATNALSGPSTVPDITNQAGNEFLSNTAIDMSGGYLLTTFRYVAPRDGIDGGLFRLHKGVCFGLIDTNNNYKMWTVAAKDARDSNYSDRAVIGIQPAQTQATNWAGQNVSGSFTSSSIDTVIMTGSSAYAGMAGQYSGLLYVTGPAIISGGTSGTPLTFADLTEALPRGCSLFPVVTATGKAATFYVPLQMGGANPAHFELNQATFQWPTQASEADKTGTWHVDDSTVGIEFYGLSGEVRHFLGCTFISGSPFYWRFNASHSGSSDTDFTGSAVVNANVTLRSTVSLDSVTFTDCPTFTQNSAVLTNCTFNDTKVTSAAPGDADNISNSSFNSSGTGHALEIGGTAADMTLTNVEFTGYAVSDGSTGNEAIYVNIATGSMTISVSGGSTPSIRTAGATVTVQNAVTVKVTVKDANALTAIEDARVLLEVDTGGDLPAGESITITRSGSTASVSHTAHGMTTGMSVIIRGVTEDEYNGIFTISNVTANAYDYTVSGTPATPATGSPKATCAILSGLTNASGILQTTSFNYTSSQPVTGRVRKATTGTKYKTGAITGTITSNGLDTTVLLIADE